jgi:hypothetical protein
MSTNEVKLVLAARVPLENIEQVMGRPSAGGHSLGTARESGVVRLQSIWIGSFSCKGETLEQDVQEALDWLRSRRDELRELDPEVSIKVCCKLYVDREPKGFAIGCLLASRLVDVGALLLFDAYGEVRQ